MTEIWKDVVGYEGLYKVSNLGRVKSIDRRDRIGVFHGGRVLSTFAIPSGYLYVSLHKNGNKINKSVHGLVANAFLDQPCEQLEVNHINGVKTDNGVENLEWCTHLTNMNHAVTTGLHTKFGQKKVLCVETGIVYDSAVDAAKDTGANKANISKVCLKKPHCNTTGGYHWRFVDA